MSESVDSTSTSLVSPEADPLTLFEVSCRLRNVIWTPLSHRVLKDKTEKHYTVDAAIRALCLRLLRAEM